MTKRLLICHVTSVEFLNPDKKDITTKLRTMTFKILLVFFEIICVKYAFISVMASIRTALSAPIVSQHVLNVRKKSIFKIFVNLLNVQLQHQCKFLLLHLLHYLWRICSWNWSEWASPFCTSRLRELRKILFQKRLLRSLAFWSKLTMVQYAWLFDLTSSIQNCSDSEI